MTWIRFDHDEAVAPSLPLFDLQGAACSIDTFRGISNLILLFAEADNCPKCIRFAHEVLERRSSLQAEFLFITPSVEQPENKIWKKIPILIDPGGKLRSRFEKIFEFEIQVKTMLFILDFNGKPVRAWLGNEIETEDLIKKTVQAIDFIMIQCPE